MDKVRMRIGVRSFVSFLPNATVFVVYVDPWAAPMISQYMRGIQYTLRTCGYEGIAERLVCETD